MFFKKDKVEFYSTNPTALYSFPIVPASEVKFKWLERMKEFVKNETKRRNLYQTTTRCPGLFTPYQKGFILRSWYDFTVTTTGPSNAVNIQYPSKDIFINTQEGIGNHDPNFLVNFFDNNVIEGRTCHPHILKITTSWHVHVPKGWSLLQMNVPLSEESSFSAVTGIYDPLINNQITVPLYWHVTQGSVTIKAGTPLCYLLPLKLPGFEHEVREATPREYEWNIHNFRRNNTFVRNYKTMAAVAEKFFKKR